MFSCTLYSTRLTTSTVRRVSRIRFYFTNGDQIKKEDPYAQLGLQWGDGATSSEIKQAYRRQAARLHPDVNQDDSPAVALRKFQNLQKAYQTLMKLHTEYNTAETQDEWRFSVWRSGDRIALDRTDVAGVLRRRPVQPAKASQTFAGAQLGHPSGKSVRRGEYLGDGKTKSSSVGRGLNKWVQPKEFKPWDGSTTGKRASDFRESTKE